MGRQSVEFVYTADIGGGVSLPYSCVAFSDCVWNKRALFGGFVSGDQGHRGVLGLRFLLFFDCAGERDTDGSFDTGVFSPACNGGEIMTRFCAPGMAFAPCAAAE